MYYFCKFVMRLIDYETKNIYWYISNLGMRKSSIHLPIIPTGWINEVALCTFISSYILSQQSTMRLNQLRHYPICFIYKYLIHIIEGRCIHFTVIIRHIKRTYGLIHFQESNGITFPVPYFQGWIAPG